MDNIVVRILTKVFDLILLNVMWVLCSLPIVTIGVSTTALYSVLMKMADNEEGYIVKEYWKSWKGNFKQSCIIWLILILVGVILGFDYRILMQLPREIRIVGFVIWAMVALLFLVELFFVFPLIAKFKNTTSKMMINAVMIPVVKLPYALIVLGLNIICIGATILNQTTILYGIIIWFVFGIALLGYANSFILKHIFQSFIKNEYRDRDI